ncbi:MAG: hypothetical protein CMC63_06665 [Flavobacteriaceae bacterium]|jgi:hypothetical protein|nr:hypothetical protein [Flavobacteriaceae bacterium]
MELKKLINAINKIDVETQPIWGKMNSSQMLWHCKRFIIFYQNDKNYSPNFMTKTLGYFHMFFLRYVIRWDYDKYPKNTLTLKFFDPRRANGLDFLNEKKELIQRLKSVNDFNKSFIINPLHGKVTKETFKEVVRGHTSYHLKQFGVL